MIVVISFENARYGAIMDTVKDTLSTDTTDSRDAQWIDGIRAAGPRSADDRSVLVGAGRPATPQELIAFVTREQERIARERSAPQRS